MSVLTAFDADVLIYAATAGNPWGDPVFQLFAEAEAEIVGIGSVLLLPEILTKPLREHPDSPEATALEILLSRLELHPLTKEVARYALALGVTYGLRAADASHLATAVAAGADRFLTNNRKDFPKSISEIEIVYPEDLSER